MKRYIEIIFDDSGSMNDFVNGEQKHVIAKKLFKEKIIPFLGKKGDIVILRTLGNSCEVGNSNAIKLENDINLMMNEIQSINCKKSTPLYYTIKDSIEDCKMASADEKHIFILTDGDDTCGVLPEQVLGKDYFKIKDQVKLNTILVQFAVNNSLSQNNLSAFSQKFGATNVIINSNDLVDFNFVGNKLNKAFRISGLDKNSPFPHCFENIIGNKVSFNYLELFEGFDFYQVELLHKERLLSWKPNKNKEISATQKGELDFLYTLRFRNQLSESLIKQMLSQLQKPYYYSFDCIYWNFKERVWNYFDEVPQLNVLPNPNAYQADKLEEELDYQEEDIQIKEQFKFSEHYLVTETETVGFINEESFFELNKYKDDAIKIINLNDGDVIRFKRKP